MFLTEVRRHNDQELYLWASELLNNFKNKGKKFTAHYIGYGQFTLENEKILLKNDTEIVVCFDYVLKDSQTYIIEQLEKNKNIKLIWIGAQKDLFDHPRVENIFWPGDMLLQNKEYSKFDRIEKKPSINKHWISTSLGTPAHRIYAASLLKGLGFDKYGELRIKTAATNGHPTLVSYVKDRWELQDELGDISPQAEQGYKKLIQRSWWGSSLFLYSQYLELGWNQNNNALNFDRNLTKLYRETCLELVNETVHGYDPVFITEKFINAVIGMNLIIINGPAGTVKLLENLGWNSCRHIVDHNYDDIKNPIMRCEQAIRLNEKLFTNPEHCISAWRKNFDILNENSKWARDCLYNKILKNCEDRLKEII
jgi:hypothetical protein